MRISAASVTSPSRASGADPTVLVSASVLLPDTREWRWSGRAGERCRPHAGARDAESRGCGLAVGVVLRRAACQLRRVPDRAAASQATTDSRPCLGLEAPVVGDVGGCLLGVDPVWRGGVGRVVSVECA